jgi:hypothetical protein
MVTAAYHFHIHWTLIQNFYFLLITVQTKLSLAQHSSEK